MRHACVVTALLSVVAAPAPAGAQDTAAAEALFREGRQLMELENYEEACERFALSQRLDPALGTLMNLALCHERLGNLATAWARFTEAADLAARQEDYRESVARERARALEPRLTRLAIELAGEPPPDLVVTRNGDDVTDFVGTAVPVDPGTYVVEARASDRVPWSRSVEISEEGATYVIRLDAEQEERVIEEREPDTAADAVGAEPSERGSLRPLGYLWLGATGVFAGGAIVTHRAEGLTGARNTLVAMSAGSLLTAIVLFTVDADRSDAPRAASVSLAPFTTSSEAGLVVLGRF